MDHFAKLAIGGGALAAAMTLAATLVPGSPVVPAAQATGLTRFEDCDQLLDWYVEHSLDQVGPYGWGGPVWMMREGMSGQDMPAQDSMAPQPSAKGGVTNGATGTNTQEAGVDEPDVAKTDGRIVVRLTDSRRVVITDVTGRAPRDLAAWRLPRDLHAENLLLVGDHVLLTGGSPMLLGGVAEDRIAPWPGGQGGTTLVDLDISDPGRPQVESTTTWSGRQLSLRQYGDTVRLVTATGLPDLPFVQPRPGRRGEAEATERNRAVVRSSVIEDWLPEVTARGSSRPAVSCGDVFHPEKWSGSDTVTVAAFRPGEVDDSDTVAVTAAGGEVYSSQDRLYVTASDWGGDQPIPLQERGKVAPVRDPRTHIHAFGLDGLETEYVASGSIDGTVRDRWSLDEYDGHLRVAVSWPDRRSGGSKESGIVVLAERGGRLVETGRLTGLGVDEEIQSVRWFDDLAIIVTFRQVDPLYTIDLGDPGRPRKLGELKIPGFSSYLHPIGGDRLLGIGTDATLDGRGRGAQAAVYDIGGPQARQVGKTTFGNETTLGASQDPHAFTWLPEHDVAITTLHGWADQDASMVLLRVSPSGDLRTEDLPSPGGWSARALPLDDGRVALVGEDVRLVAAADLD